MYSPTPPTSINLLNSFSVVYSVLNKKDISVQDFQRDKVIIQYVNLILVPNSLDWKSGRAMYVGFS